MSEKNGCEENNSGFSLIIPTYNRTGHLRRILSYYDEYGGDYNIIVADSSSDENKRLNKKIISSFSNLNILYHSHYSSKINQYHKLADAVNYANGKYCIQTGDDDFITPNGINQSVDFLEKNPDFTVAHGYYISFYLKTDKKGKRPFCWTPIYSHESITLPDPVSRLNEHLAKYSLPTLYAVHRTDFLKMVFKETLKFTDDVRFGELLPSMLALIYGKMKCLDVLYCVRENTPRSLGERAENLKDFIKVGTYDEKYAKFRDCLAMHLSKKSQLDVGESKRVVDDAMSVYLSTCIMKKESTNYKRILIHKMSDILDYLRLPEWMDEGIRSGYRKLFLLKQMQMKDFRSSVDVPSSKYYNDFNKIRLHVLSYSNSKK